jgi:hypothetical protein
MEYELVEFLATNKNGKAVTKERYPKLYGKRRKEQKQEQAEARQAERDKLTLKEKAARAVPDSKEHKRLLEQIEKAKA